ncbi:MAG TPA: agmatinase [Bryobacteraceae bacterium]|nr:agmatinase [Bryobacteraceae bacterium]
MPINELVTRNRKKLSEPHPLPVDAMDYPRFAGIPTFFRLPHITDPARLDVALIGVPFDGGTSYRTGARMGPRHVREQSAIIRPYNPALQVSPFSEVRVADFGDLSVNPLSIQDTYDKITKDLKPILAAGTIPICLGGDHSILLPILRAIHAQHGPVALIQLDAHSDTWDQYWGQKYSHGTPVRRAIEENLLDEPYILQVGLRGQLYGPDDMDYCNAHNIGVITGEEFQQHGLALVQEKLKGFGARKTYLTLDIDVVDPAFAPGTGTPQVGGLTSHQIVELVRSLRVLNLVGCDLVEVSPQYDAAELTSLLAANLLFEQLCLFCFGPIGQD